MALLAALASCAWALVAAAAALYALVRAIRAVFFAERTAPGKCSVAFFHPYW